MLATHNIQADIITGAELAGLMLLRESKADLANLDPGSVILGATPDEVQERIQKFVLGWAISNGLESPKEFSIPEDAKNYNPRVADLEAPLAQICKRNEVKTEYFPFVAATAAMRLVQAGKKTKVLDPIQGVCIVSYHLIAGSKTVPYPAKDKPISNELKTSPEL